MALGDLMNLAEALQSKNLVRFNVPGETFVVTGYVLDVGPEYFIISTVSDRIWLDGFECFQVGDVRDLRLDPYSKFVESALTMRGEHPPTAAPASVASIVDLLETAGRAFPLITIHEVNSDGCHVGRVIEVSRYRVSLLEIDPHAQWDIEPTDYSLGDIVRVTFGGDYENALALVGRNSGTNEE